MVRDVPPVGTSGVGNCLLGLFVVPFIAVKMLALRIYRATREVNHA